MNGQCYTFSSNPLSYAMFYTGAVETKILMKFNRLLAEVFMHKLVFKLNTEW